MKPLFFAITLLVSAFALAPIAFALQKSGESLFHPYILFGVALICFCSVGFAIACTEDEPSAS